MATTPLRRVFGAGTGSSGALTLLGKTTLLANNNKITVSAIPLSIFLKIVAFVQGFDVADHPTLQFNTDVGAHYAERYFSNGVSGSNTGQTSLLVTGLQFTTSQILIVEVMNYTTLEKPAIVMLDFAGTLGGSNPPGYELDYCKWANTSAQITQVDAIGRLGHSFLAGSELLVYGYQT